MIAALVTRALGFLAPGLWWIVGGAFASTLAWGGVMRWQRDDARQERQELRDAWTLETAERTRTALTAALDAAADTKRRLGEQKEANDEAYRLANRARSAAAGAAVAAIGLRDAAASAAGRCATRADPGAVAVSAPANATGLVLADVLGRADDTAGELAAALDLAYVSGRQCEREHDALEKRALRVIGSEQASADQLRRSL